jgi:hypothetical protein
VGLEEQARIPAHEVLNRAAQGAQRHYLIRVRGHAVPSLCLLYRIADVEQRETVVPQKRQKGREKGAMAPSDGTAGHEKGHEKGDMHLFAMHKDVCPLSPLQD